MDSDSQRDVSRRGGLDLNRSDSGDKAMVLIWALICCFTFTALGVSAHGWAHRADHPLPSQNPLLKAPNGVWLE